MTPLDAYDLRHGAVTADSLDHFLTAYGHVFEHSPWVVERAWEFRPFADAEALNAAFRRVLDMMTEDEQLRLVRAHPELADKLAIAQGMTDSSVSEQASAGLDQLTPTEFETFQALNTRYRTQNSFPFIICVRLHDKAEILAAMQQRVARSRADELREAIEQIGRIVLLRLKTLLVDAGLASLNAQVRHGLEMLDLAGPDWVRPRRSDARVYDVVIVGGGQSGLGAAFGLWRERVRNLLVIDENPAGQEGPWDTYARMITLRTAKHLTPLDFGMPALTFRAWWEAQHGPASWDAIGKIPRRDWMAYLRWYREILRLPVQNSTRLTRVGSFGDGVFSLDVTTQGRPETLLARKVVFATGIQGGGEWHTPRFIRDVLPKERYSHTSENIDFAALNGKRVGILGGGASAFDNAQYALSQGIAEAHVFIRREDLPRSNPIRHMEAAGFIPHYASLDDAEKYNVISHFLTVGQPPTNDTFNRAAAYDGFRFHVGAPWEAVSVIDGKIAVTTPKGEFLFDHLILSTGLQNDVALRPELADFAGDIALWRDRYCPPQGTANRLVDEHPYLGPAFEYTGRTPESQARLHGLFAFNYSALASLGLTAASVSGLKFALPKLVAGIAQQLFLDDQEGFMTDYLNYADVEFVGQWPGS